MYTPDANLYTDFAAKFGSNARLTNMEGEHDLSGEPLIAKIQAWLKERL